MSDLRTPPLLEPVPGMDPREARELARRHGLPRLGGRPSLPDYLRMVWQRRHFGWELGRSRFRADTSQDRLGIAWVVLKPLISATVYGLVFGLLLPSSTRGPNFVAFLVAGIFTFQFFSASLSDGAKAITSNLGIVRTLHFPRALLPMASVQQQSYGFVPMVVVLLVIVLGTGEPVTLRWLQLLPVVALLTAFNLGVAFVAARATLHVRDISQLLPFLIRLLFYVSGVFYSLEAVVTDRTLSLVLQANPVAAFMELVRGAVIVHEVAEPVTWLVAGAWAVGALLFGLVFFWHAEERYGRE